MSNPSKVTSYANFTETIIAPITPQGRGAVAIIRISGSQVLDIAEKFFRCIPKHQVAKRAYFFAQDRIVDEGLLIFFKGPHSFTGEDVLEFQGHGSAILVNSLLNFLLEFPNTRLALPGEFSERAFLNGKMDLTQAEAICDLINAESKQEAAAAMNSLQGAFSKILGRFEARLIALRSRIEVALDFLDEDFSVENERSIKESILSLNNDLKHLCSEAKKNLQQKNHLKIGLIGVPNVGKSSLFNLLIQKDRAIVTHLAGTTRDFIEENLRIGSENFAIFDTAGLRESLEPIEKIGITRTQKLLNELDVVFWIEDVSKPTKVLNFWIAKALDNLQKLKIPIIGIWNKTDLSSKVSNSKHHTKFAQQWLNVSCQKSDGIKELKAYLLKNFKKDHQYSEFFAKKRHLIALEKAIKIFPTQNALFGQALMSWDQIADALIQVQNFLGEITGKTYTEDLLDSIFSTFCLGK